MVVEWGDAWTVQRVRVLGSNGGDGADEVGEYNTAALPISVPRANTWVWGTGHTQLGGIAQLLLHSEPPVQRVVLGHVPDLAQLIRGEGPHLHGPVIRIPEAQKHPDE